MGDFFAKILLPTLILICPIIEIYYIVRDGFSLGGDPIDLEDVTYKAYPILFKYPPKGSLEYDFKEEDGEDTFLYYKLNI